MTEKAPPPIPRTPFGLLASLYISQSVPLGFFIIALPAIARSEGLSLELVGLLQTLAFPFLIKFLWAPLVDRFGATRSHYTSWIFPLQSLSLLAVLGLACLEPFDALSDQEGTSHLPVFLLTIIFMISAATQDVATDGLAVKVIPKEKRGIANGVQVGGYYFGQVLGGGVALLLYHQLGWMFSLGIMMIPLGMPLFFLVGFRESKFEASAGDSHVGIGFVSLKQFFQRSGIWTWIIVLLSFRAGEQMALTMLNPMLIDFGYSLARVGMIVGLIGSVTSLGGALIGGSLVQRIGRQRSLVCLLSLLTLALLSYQFPSYTGAWASVVIAVGLVSFAGGAATTALYTAMMDRCRHESSASDFTLQQSICAIGPLIAVGLSGFSASALGYPGHFLLSAAVATFSTYWVARMLRPQDGIALRSAPLPGGKV
ncbi:MAG: MFS transporter [Verrucomicrobiota bacterium]